MYKYIFFVLLALSLDTVVNGNVTVCIPLKNNGNSVEGQYSLLVKNLKEGVTVLLEDNSTIFFDHLDFDLHHPAVSMKGEVNNLTVANLDDYEMKFFSEIDMGQNEIQLFNLTFKNISAVGEYNMTGNIGDLFDIWGAGHFWANVLNFSVAADSKIPSINDSSVCLNIDTKTKLQSQQAWFYGIMDDEELEEVINHTFARLIPEAVEVIWQEVKDAIDGPLQKWIDSIIYGKSSRIGEDVL